MAFETELGNIATQTDVISDGISAALVQSVTCLPLIYLEDIPSGLTNVKKFRKDGNLVAEAVAESAQYTFSANSELTQTTITSTATKTAVASKLTLEAQEFSPMTIDQIAVKQAQAINRDLDDDILALNSGFGNTVTCGSTATVAKILEAQYTVRSGTAGVSKGRLTGWFGYKAIWSLQDELAKSGASVFSLKEMVSLLEGLTDANGYKGNISGVDIFETDGHPTSGADDVQLVFDPMLALAGMVSPSVSTRVYFEGDPGGWDQVYSWVFADFVEWNDAAGCGFLSDT